MRLPRSLCVGEDTSHAVIILPWIAMYAVFGEDVVSSWGKLEVVRVREKEVMREFSYSYSAMGRGYSTAYRKDVRRAILRVFLRAKRRGRK